MRARAALLFALVPACFARPEPQMQDETPLAVGERREVELYAIRLDVTDFTEAVSKEKLLGLPPHVRENLWLYDLDLTGESGTARLLDNAMAQIRAQPLDAPGLTQAERNMVRMLAMTPDTADLRRTSLEPLLEIAPQVGFSSAEILAEAVGIGVEDAFMSDDAVTRSVVDAIIRSHPNARFRPGPKTDANPDGLVPVPWGHLPITLEDAASDMKSLAVRYGPYQAGGVYHPGFVVEAGAQILGDDFQMVLKANANAMPFKGVDLTNATRGNISSIGRDSGQLFDFSDPEWLRIEGLREDVVVDEMVFQILEHPERIPGSTSPLPAPTGDSPVWTVPSWTVEQLVARAGLAMYGDHQFYKEYYLANPANPLFTVSITDGWMSITTLGDVGSPPPPLYIWDLFLEVAQARLHDGPDPTQPDVGAIPEGEGNLRFTLHDIEIGVTSDQIRDAIRKNLEDDPQGLIATAGVLLDQSKGVPDFYYYLPRPSSADAGEGDWLLYITADDVALDESGLPVAPYEEWTRPGFFSDEGLTTKTSSLTPIDGDTTHEKLRIEAGDVFFAADHRHCVTRDPNAGNACLEPGPDPGPHTYRIEVLAKPSRAKIALAIERVR